MGAEVFLHYLELCYDGECDELSDLGEDEAENKRRLEEQIADGSKCDVRYAIHVSAAYNMRNIGLDERDFSSDIDGVPHIIGCQNLGSVRLPYAFDEDDIDNYIELTLSFIKNYLRNRWIFMSSGSLDRSIETDEEPEPKIIRNVVHSAIHHMNKVNFAPHYQTFEKHI